MSILGDTRMDNWVELALRAAGATFGVLLSMIFVAPENTRATWYRLIFAPPAGFVFARPMQNVLWFLQGDGWEYTMPAAVAAGFVGWFMLEAAARGMASQKWIERTLEEILRLRGGSKDKA